jgi:hypothetical protein
MVIYNAMGLIGLLTTLFVPATRLDTFVVDDQALHQIDARGELVEWIPWRAVVFYLHVRRAVWNRPTPSLSFDYLRSETGRAMSLSAATQWFGHLQSEIEARILPDAQTHAVRAYGGLPFVYLALAFPITFLILDLAFYPALSVDAHAILAVVYIFVSLIIVGYVSHRWIAHYVRVYGQMTEPRRFILGVGVVGILLVVMSFVFREALYPLQLLPTVWGISVLWVWVGAHEGLPVRTRSPRGHWITRLIVLLCGLFLIWQQTAPTLLHLAAFTYGGAVQSLDPAESLEASDRRHAFRRMERVSRGMLALDPAFKVAYGFLGVAHHAQGRYEAAVDAYTTYIDSSGSPNLYDCRAFAYLAMGKAAQAEEDFDAYGLPCDSVDVHYCDRYFPGARDQLCQP